MKLVIYGGRNFDDYDLMVKTLINMRGITAVICGMANGADLMGKRWAEENGIPVIKKPADWDLHGKARAGKIRNTDMANICDIAIGFWDGKSTDTKHMNGRLKAFNKPHNVIKFVPNKFKDFEKSGTLDDFF